jgi:hypothetical protein
MASLRKEVLKELKELKYHEGLTAATKLYILFTELVDAVKNGEEDNFFGSHNFLPNTFVYFKKMGAYLKNKCTIEISRRDPDPSETFVTLPEVTKGVQKRLSDLKNVQLQMEELVERNLAFRSTKKSKSVRKNRKSAKKSVRKAKKSKTVRKSRK